MTDITDIITKMEKLEIQDTSECINDFTYKNDIIDDEEILIEGRCFKNSETEIPIKINNQNAILFRNEIIQKTKNNETDIEINISDELKNIIKNNNYIKCCVSDKKKDYNSFSYLIKRNLSQSECIKIGYGMENVLRDIILKKNTNLKSIKPKNQKGKKEKDHLFINETLKTIYYAELKSNLNLDTEKCLSTYNKCLQILEELKTEYHEYKIKMYLIGLRYYKTNSIPKQIEKKYLPIRNNLLGVNEYLNELDIDITFTNEENYKCFLNYLVDNMFD